jgi:hypothetical protein
MSSLLLCLLSQAVDSKNFKTTKIFAAFASARRPDAEAPPPSTKQAHQPQHKPSLHAQANTKGTVEPALPGHWCASQAAPEPEALTLRTVQAGPGRLGAAVFSPR